MSDPIRIYLASSWRNPRYSDALVALRMAGFDVYDFKSEASFQWHMLDPAWWNWRAAHVRDALEHRLVRRAFEADKKAIDECDALVMLMPCGSSAHTEFGYAAGLGKRTTVILPRHPTSSERDSLSKTDLMYLDDGARGTAEVMYRLADDVCISVEEAVDAIREWERRKP